MGIRGEVSEFDAVKMVSNNKSCCDGTGMGQKARRYFRQLESDSSTAVAEFSLARCVRGIAKAFCAKGGCDNTRAERVISILILVGPNNN